MSLQPGKINIEIFPKVSEVPEIAQNVIQKRYLHEGETSWYDITERVVEFVLANEDENQTCEVKITGFNWTGFQGFGPVGTLYGEGFNVTLDNLGTVAIEGVKVEVKKLANDSELWSETWLDLVDYEGQVKSRLNPTFKLSAGEIRVFNGTFMRRMGDVESEVALTFKVICMSNSTILDELVLP